MTPIENLIAEALYAYMTENPEHELSFARSSKAFIVGLGDVQYKLTLTPATENDLDASEFIDDENTHHIRDID